MEEALPGSRRGPSYSSSRSLGSSSQYGPAAGASSSSRKQQKPSPAVARKPPEPLRRAVADCLSSAATVTIASGAPSSLHGNPSAIASEASRSLRDYIADPSTTDMAYSVLVEHALAERDRSPAVVPKCVALLKRYLLRYVPRLKMLQQIDQFCVNLIAECESVASQSLSKWSKPLDHNSGTSPVAHMLPSSPASNFASASLVKSLNYVRSLVTRHIPKLSFQPIPPEASTAPKQSLPSLSSLLSRTFSSQLSAEVVDSRDTQKEDSVSTISRLSSLEKVNAGEHNKYIFFDLLKWRWPGAMENQFASFAIRSNTLRSEDARYHRFLNAGAAALPYWNAETKAKDQYSKYHAQDLPDVSLLQPSTATIAKDYASARSHLKAITSSKRIKPGPHQIWSNVPTNTFHPRARPLFQYRHYSEQQPLKLNFAEIQEVMAEVCSESSPLSVNQFSSSRVPKNSAQPATDVAVSVLIKLVIDMYVMDPGTAAPLTLYMLEGMLSSGKVSSRARAFDFILNLGVHAQLLEPILSGDQPVDSLQEPHFVNEEKSVTQEKINAGSNLKQRLASAVDTFESWLLVILFEILRLLVQTEEKEEIVWASALSCLFYFVCDKGQILRKRLDGFDIRVLKALLEISREHSWSEIVHCKLICMLANMFYHSSEVPADGFSEVPTFVNEQVDRLGGIELICVEYSKANLREEKQNLFLVLFDYVVYQINEACLANGVSVYTHDEIQPIISMLNLANAPEAFHIAVKNGVEGMGEILKQSVSAALMGSSKCERLNMLLDKIMRKLDSTISAFTRLDSEFTYMIGITRKYKSFASISNGDGQDDMLLEARLSWATLHSLLHSDRASCRHNGYIWLVELLVSEISDNNHQDIWSNIKKFEDQIEIAGSQDSAYLKVPLSICLMCGLLKSKNNFIRLGFLKVLEKLLVRCKLLLDENKHGISSEDGKSHRAEDRFDKANAVVDIMSAALSLVVNETDHTNILKMCDMLFAQLCLRHNFASEIPFEDFRSLSHFFGRNHDLEVHVSSETLQAKNNQKDELLPKVSTHDDMDTRILVCETSSMAALLLRGHAIAPMQLVARVPASLFYWPLIQLAGAATDDIALGVAVGSKGRGNLPGATSDIRAALLLLLIGKCTVDSEAFSEIEGKEFFRGLLEDTDSRVAYYSAAFLLKRMMTEEPEAYQRMLQSLIIKAQQCNNEKLLENPYLQMRGILQLSNDLGAQI